MKIQIRKGVFETNSSSTHALCLGKGNYEKFSEIKFGVLSYKEYWSTENCYQHRVDTLYAAIIGKDNWVVTDSFIRLGKLINLLKEANIQYSFNFEEDYLENNLPYMENTKWVDIVLENVDNLLRYLFNDSSLFMECDRDELYRKGGWNSVVDFTKCDLYDTD